MVKSSNPNPAHTSSLQTFNNRISNVSLHIRWPRELLYKAKINKWRAAIFKITSSSYVWVLALRQFNRLIIHIVDVYIAACARIFVPCCHPCQPSVVQIKLYRLLITCVVLWCFGDCAFAAVAPETVWQSLCWTALNNKQGRACLWYLWTGCQGKAKAPLGCCLVTLARHLWCLIMSFRTGFIRPLISVCLCWQGPRWTEDQKLRIQTCRPCVMVSCSIQQLNKVIIPKFYSWRVNCGFEVRNFRKNPSFISQQETKLCCSGGSWLEWSVSTARN